MLYVLVYTKNSYLVFNNYKNCQMSTIGKQIFKNLQSLHSYKEYLNLLNFVSFDYSKGDFT